MIEVLTFIVAVAYLGAGAHFANLSEKLGFRIGGQAVVFLFWPLFWSILADEASERLDTRKDDPGP